MHTDYVIVGAGCAGLSLAAHLAARGLGGRRLTLVDPRAEFARDRTWCFWGVHDHLFAGAVTHRWPRWRVRAPGADVVCGPGRYAYQHLPADRFYAAALDRLRGTSGVRLLLGARAGDVVDEGDHVRVETDRGPVRARAAFDSRATGARPADGRRDDVHDVHDVHLAQQFVGLFVRASRPTFDPGTATLMHFGEHLGEHLGGAGEAGGIRFTYLLPFTARDALVEATIFAADAVPDDELRRRALAYLAAHHPGVAFTVVGAERGRLPMTTARAERRPSPRVYRIGVAGGLAKPSTGYAFLAIQRDAAELARRLAAAPGAALPDAPRPRGARATFLDRVFLSYLRRHPARAPELFTRLFARAPADAVVRFLSETGTAADQARVIGALPLWPFAAEAARSARLWLRA